MPDAQEVKKLFNAASGRYNFVNSILSFGLDSHWRKEVAKAVTTYEVVDILDVATGSGVLAFALARRFTQRNLPLSLTGLDFSEALLCLARQDLLKHSEREAWPCSMRFLLGNALVLPFAEGSFHALTVGFGLRNFENRQAFYAQALRVLRPGGQLFVLEFSQPHWLLRPLYQLYLSLLPFIAILLGQQKADYAYLRDTIRAWPTPGVLSQEMLGAGFSHVQYQRLSFGIVALHVASKASP